LLKRDVIEGYGRAVKLGWGCRNQEGGKRRSKEAARKNVLDPGKEAAMAHLS